MSQYEKVTDNGVTFELRASETLYYANSVNNLGFIQELSISSNTVLTDVLIRISFMSASGQISLPFSFEVGQLGTVPFVEKNVQVKLDANVMFQIADAQSGSIRVQILAAETEVANAIWPVKILPANFWIAGGSPSDYTSMAAFVQPNHPSVRTLLNDAVAELKTMGKSPVLSGYQDLSHVDGMAQAAYQALKKRSITYSNPPASWSGWPGQKIRTAQEILDEGVGTCLDTAVLFASCLEQMGLEPLLAIVPGHAFVGYWSAESKKLDGNLTLAVDPLQTIESIGNLIDLGFIRLFETTVVCEDSDLGFDQAVAQGKVSLEDAKAFGVSAYESFLVNVTRCRFPDVAIYPMPAKFVDAEGKVTITEFVPRETDLAALRKAFNEQDGQAGNTLKLNVPPTVKKWLDGLLDLSLRNPLINLKERQTSIRLLVPGEALGYVEDLLQGDKSFRLTHGVVQVNADGQNIHIQSETDRGESSQKVIETLKQALGQQIIATNTTPDGFVSRMRRIHSEAKAFQEETGSNGLYLALGTLRWKTNNAELDSPLILVPVSLTAKNRGKEFFMTLEESGVTPNFSLVEKLKSELKLNLDGLTNLQTDNFGVDVDATLQYVREELQKAGLNEFRVDQTATLGFFNFSSFRLWKDLLENWQKFERNPLVKHLIHTPGEAFEDPSTTELDLDLDELIAQLPIPADGSQALAVAQAISGKTFILQGPPGTGKSQTITNLLAKALDEGKRVLFVAEKKDALDVVKNRMDACGIGAFSLDLHDKGSTSKAVRQQLDEVIDILISPDKVGFESALQEYESALGPLKNYREQLHSVGPLGESIYTAKDKYLAVMSSYELNIPGEFIANTTPEVQGELTSSVKSIASIGATEENASLNPWSLSRRISEITSSEMDEIKQISNRLESSLGRLRSNSAIAEFISVSENFDELFLLDALRHDNLPASAVEFGMTRPGKEQLEVAEKALAKQLKNLESSPYSLGRLGAMNMKTLEDDAQLAVASNFLLKGFKTSKVIKSFNSQLGLISTISKTNLLDEIAKTKKIKSHGEKCSRELTAVTGLRFEDEINPFEISDVRLALETLQRLISVTSLASFDKASSGLTQRMAIETPSDVRVIAHEFVEDLQQLGTILETSPSQVEMWKSGSNLEERLASAVTAWNRDAREYGLSQLLRWNSLMAASEPFVAQGLDDALNSLLSGAVPFGQALNAFQKGFYRALFENLLVKRGLNSFEGASINNYIRKLDEAHKELRIRLPKILGAELLSRRGFDSSMKIGAIGDLVLAIKQSRNNLPLRLLLARHWDIITRITPCVLASPDSAVRFIDPSFEPFDLVVFDEASQIRVANSIGALGRAKAAVVVGDSQQMPPTSVAQSKGATDEDDLDDEDSFIGEPESILTQCEIARVPEIMLTWHYRSEDESLIAYSNQAYYEGKLSTFPNPYLGTSDKKLTFKHVSNGQFIRSSVDEKGAFEGQRKAGLRTNPAEAKAIIDEITARLQSPEKANDSIGVVTFNMQQRRLIEAMLQDSDEPVIIDALEKGVGGEPIFVKNLESVQGSERDVILFSIAFSAKKDNPNDLPLNFGPITHGGGHKRLNVAITRARKEVKIFASFLPKVLVDKKPPSRGLSNLSDYLVMAAGKDASDIASLATRESKQDRHRHEVLTKLRKSGLTALEEIGLSDFKVDIAIVDPKNPNKAVLGILLDGPRWNARTTVSDRDTLPVGLLTNRMGWPAIERIWLPNWLRDEKGELERIKSAFELAKKASPAKPSKPIQVNSEPIFTRKSADDTANSSNPVDDLMASVADWAPLGATRIASQDYLNYLNDPQIKKAVNDIVRQLADLEGPVSSLRVGKFVASCFDFNRVVPARIEAINSIISRDFKRDAEGFVYPKGSSPNTFESWKKSAPGAGRVASEISLVEIANAMKDICRVAGGVRFEQLVKETSKVFGIQKMSKEILARFEDAVVIGGSTGRLRIDGDYVLAL